MVVTTGHGRYRGLATVLSVVLIVTATIVTATSGDSWAVKMILALVAVDVAARLYRWGRT